MGQKMTTLILFRSEIPHDELVNVAYFFVLIYFCFPENLQKLFKMLNTIKMADIGAASMYIRTSLVKRQSRFSSICIFVC